MTNLFLKIVNMSISASWLIFAVLLIRLFLRRFPKWIHMFLWGLVGFKLINPFSIESAMSLIPSSETISLEIMIEETPTITSGIENVDKIVNPIVQASFAPVAGDSANPLQIWIPVSAIVWVIGVFLLFSYIVVSYCRLYNKVNTAVILQENIFQSENIFSPFVLGIFRPKIYLPFAVPSSDVRFIVAHERVHIERHDHWWKPLGFIVLAIHWFNPFVWLSYILLCRDIELACDEKVIMNLDNGHRADYSQALLSCSTNHRITSACPLAFGEVGVKERVMSIMRYKKPAFWILVLAGIVCAIVAVCFLTDPIRSVNDNLFNPNNDVMYHTYPSESTGLRERSDSSVETGSEDTSQLKSSGSVENSDSSVETSSLDHSPSIPEEWGSGEVYDGSAPIIRKMGEELRINALPPRKQTEEPLMSTEVFAMWEGEMSFTVTSAEFFDSIEETGLNYDDFIDKFELYPDTYKPLVIKLIVKNINAQTSIDINENEPYIFYSGGFILSCKEEFSPEKFRSRSYDEWSIGSVMPLVYVDPHSDSPNYYFYTLKEGETVELTMCFYADTAAAPPDEWYLEIITTSDDHRFGFTLDQLN